MESNKKNQINQSRESVNDNVSKYSILGIGFSKKMAKYRRWRST